MLLVLRWVGFALGLFLVLVTWKSVVNTVILPRVISSRITYRCWLAVRGAFLHAANRFPDYEAKDRTLAYLAPVYILAILVCWLALFFVGFALLVWPLIPGDFGAALQLSGSSMFTLGFATSGMPGPTIFEFLAAATGLVVVALQIGYLPSIYGAYNRRETLVTSLNSRAGAPAWGPEILARHQLSQARESLPALYAAWEGWSADIAESHSSYPWLMAFRSPSHLNSWVISLLAILDSANLYITLAPSKVPAEARQCLRMGFVGLRTLARVNGTPVNNDPLPIDPVALTYDEFAEGVEHLRLAGFPLERTAEEAWPDFRGWRVNYEAAAYALAHAGVAVPAPWSGPRTFAVEDDQFDVLANRPRHRTPDDPEGLNVRTRQRPTPGVSVEARPHENGRGLPALPAYNGRRRRMPR
jgi:hypothetical protein